MSKDVLFDDYLGESPEQERERRMDEACGVGTHTEGQWPFNSPGFAERMSERRFEEMQEKSREFRRMNGL